MTSPGLPTALIVEIPEAEPAVGPLRDRLDPNARLGVPAHITVIYPFAPAEAIDTAARQRLADLFGSIFSFGFRLDQVGWFGQDVLWLGPADPAPFQALTERVAAEFPAYPPFEGRFAEVVVHLTVGQGGPVGELRAAEEAVRPRLPIDGAVRAVTLLASEPGGRWRRRATFSLGW
jgi:2'-5' RNA ligase superfamily